MSWFQYTLNVVWQGKVEVRGGMMQARSLDDARIRLVDLFGDVAEIVSVEPYHSPE
jgi:hypothetical protein